MEEVKKMQDPEEFLRQTRQIFEEREQEFQMREQAFQEKQVSLQRLLCEIADNKHAVEEQTHAIAREQESLANEQADLGQQKEELTQQQAALREQVAMVEDREKRLLMQHNLELEKLRNEEMKLKRLTEDYEYKLTLMDHGITPAAQENGQGETLLRSEHEELVAKLNQEHQRERAALVQENDALQAERKDLLKRILELNAQLEEQTNPQPQKETEEKPENSHPDAGSRAAFPICGPTPEDAGEEELTAEVLKRYLKKNEPRFEKLEIRHSETGDQLCAEYGGLHYHFLFTKPASFDISASRKQSSKLYKLLEELNAEYPGVQFRYDKQEACVYATGFFTNDRKPYELMKQVKEVSNCFRQE